MQKELITLLAVLFLVTACTPGGTTPANTSDTSDTVDTTGDTKTDEKIVPIESNLEYCKMVLKTLQAQVNTYERQERTIQANIDATKKKLADLKASGASPEKIKEEQQDLDDLSLRLKDAQAALVQPKKEVANANTKCGKMAKKADKAICAEFKADIQERTKQTQNSLLKEEANLANINKQYDAAKQAGKSSEFLASIDEEKEKKNLDILKIKNNVDNLGQMLVQLEEYCK